MIRNHNEPIRAVDQSLSVKRRTIIVQKLIQ